MIRNLPPDTDGTNASRSLWAGKALEAYAKTTGLHLPLERQEAVADLLADLMHFCDRNEIDFTQAFETAMSNYKAETTENEDKHA